MGEAANLLIVDDERGPMESLRMIFKPAYQVYTASGGPEAIEIVHQTPIDVVTLDLRMPGMSGIEVMEQIKQHDPDIEVVIVTGYSSLDTAIRGLRFRAFDYISKPFDVSEISDIVRRAVNQRRTTQRLRLLKENFLANLSHELRTPLSAIIGYTAILNDECERQATPEQRLAIERIQANSHDLLNLVEAVLLLSSLEAGELSLNTQVFDLGSTVGRVLRRYESTAQEKGLLINTRLQADDLKIFSDELLIERLLWALLDNAVKFTPRGSVTVSAALTPTGDQIRLSVIDNGIGMSAEEVRHVIEGLSQSDDSTTRRYRGLGLGLRVATRLVGFLGGHLTLQSREGAGTTVVVTLPRRPPANGTHRPDLC